MTPSHTFHAMFDGICAAGCPDRIHPGDVVRYDDNDELRHDECTPKRDPLELGANEVVCGVCWITPCRC